MLSEQPHNRRPSMGLSLFAAAAVPPAAAVALSPAAAAAAAEVAAVCCSKSFKGNEPDGFI